MNSAGLIENARNNPPKTEAECLIALLNIASAQMSEGKHISAEELKMKLKEKYK